MFYFFFLFLLFRLKTATFTKLAQSDRHLFVGTSTGLVRNLLFSRFLLINYLFRCNYYQVAVFNKHPVCEREDIHLCTAKKVDPSYCLQVTLRLPNKKMSSGNPPQVTGLICPQIGPEFPTLWASDTTGQLTIWYIPHIGLEFTPAYTMKIHNSAVTTMAKTWRHVITTGDDGFILLHDVLTFTKVRSVNVMEWGNYRSLFSNEHIDRKIKSIHLEENYDSGGHLVVGTSYGDIVLISLGTTV
jgi:hypothetical protein